MDYDALADIRGVGRDVLEARVKTLAARAKELEAELAAMRAPALLGGVGANGPVGPSRVWVGETRPSLEVLGAALASPGVPRA